MPANLVIVESPAKAKTIEKYLGKDYKVLSSFGHVRDLPRKGMAVDIENNFQPTYEISEEKTKVISELRKATKQANMVYLASDDDREGEAISWHLKEVLKLTDAQTKRIVFHEITKPAIIKAIEHPRTIDQNLVNAQQARRVLDRLVGFELSPVLWKKIKTGLSAGRVQSVAVRLVVEREREIEQFTPEESYKVTAVFQNEKKVTVAAELPSKFATKEEAEAFLQDCIAAKFTVENIEKKDGTKSPGAPFTTSTLQQEASRKLGYSVAQTMRLAQKLYEAGHITYMRTDSLNLSETALSQAAHHITESYGEEYATRRTFKTKSSGAQEAHEAIRPTNFEHHEAGSDAREKKLYQLIWRRTIASQMSEAKIERTIAKISVSTRKEQFSAKGQVIVFDGFMKVYGFDKEDKSEMLPALRVGEELRRDQLIAKQSFSKHPARYTEATLVKTLEEKGIGRPSTYAPTISTVQNRGYVVKDTRDGKQREVTTMTLSKDTVDTVTALETYGSEKNKLFPTNVAMVVNDFLVEHFTDVVDYGFTAEVEEEFDRIADGKKQWNNMIAEFYKGFHSKVETTTQMDRRDVPTDRVLGTDPKTGRQVKVRLGRFGPLAQIGEQEDEEPVKFAGLETGQFIETITLEEALALFKFPRELGQYEDKPVSIGKGRFGPYVKHDNKFVSIPKEENPGSITLERSIELIEAKREADKNKYIAEFEDDKGVKIELLNGRYGPYIKYEKRNVKIPKDIEDPKKLTREECITIIAEAPEKRFGRSKATEKSETTKKKATKKKTTTKKATKKKPAKKSTKK